MHKENYIGRNAFVYYKMNRSILFYISESQFNFFDKKKQKYSSNFSYWKI